MRRNYISAKTVNGLLPKIMQPVLQKRGFSAMVLLSNWSEIAGDAFAACSKPERLSWPRRQSQFKDGAQYQDETNGGTSQGSNQEAVLRLRVDPVMALEVEYQKAQIIERINTYFGYRAVTNLKIIQGPVLPVGSGNKQNITRKKCEPVKNLDVSGIEDEALRAAIMKLNENRQKP